MAKKADMKRVRIVRAEEPAAKTRCPICKRASAANFRPFCSQRCADLDLGRWLNGAYAIPTEESGDASETDSPGQLPHTD